MRYLLSEEDGRTPLPCYDFTAWVRWFGEADRQAAFDRVGEVCVSTVFIGTTEACRGGKPLLFETVAIGASDAFPPERYVAWEHAEAGHARWVARISAGLALAGSAPERQDAPPAGGRGHLALAGDSQLW